MGGATYLRHLGVEVGQETFKRSQCKSRYLISHCSTLCNNVKLRENALNGDMFFHSVV